MWYNKTIERGVKKFTRFARNKQSQEQALPENFKKLKKPIDKIMKIVYIISVKREVNKMKRMMYHLVVNVMIWGGFWFWLTENVTVWSYMSAIGILSSELIRMMSHTFIKLED